MEHGKQYFGFDDTPNVKCTFLGGPFHPRGVAKMKKLSVALHEKQKKKTILTEHGKHIFEFCNTLNQIIGFLPELIRRNPRQSAAIRRNPRKRTKNGTPDPPEHMRRGSG